MNFEPNVLNFFLFVLKHLSISSFGKNCELVSFFVENTFLQNGRLKQTQIVLSSTWGETLTMMHDLTLSLILQIYCFKSTALSHDSIIQSILQGWLSTAKYLTIWKPCVTHLFWFGKNNCISSLMSALGRVHKSLTAQWYKCMRGVWVQQNQ